jgi:VWFA-related protein
MFRGILALVVAVLAQTPPQQPQQPVFQAGVDVLRVDVQVVAGDGKPIPNLTAADFSVTIDGRPRRVLSAEIVRYSQSLTDPVMTGVAVRSPGQVPEDARIYVLAVDQLAFGAAAIMPIRHAVRRFIDKLRPEDMVGLYDFPFRVPILDVTHDHTAVSRAFERLVGLFEPGQGQFSLSPSEIVDITAGDSATFARVVRRECPPDDPSCPPAVRAEASSLAGFYESQSQLRMNGLSHLIRGLATIPGRKTVLLVSGGLMSSTRVGGRPSVTGLMSRVGEEAAAADANLYVLHWDTSYIDAYGAVGRASRNPGERFQTQFADRHVLGLGLDWIAGKAGGALLRIEAGTGDYAFDRVLRETESYYLLGVEPTDADRDGQPHFLRVDVSQRGATVRARSQILIPKRGIGS